MRRVVFFAALLLVGCGGKPVRVATHPVDGQVLYDGRPAAGVQVYLYPTGAPGVPEVPAQPHGVTDADGRFRLSTYGNDDGAAEGSYIAVLFWPGEQGEDAEESSEDRLLGWYSAVHTKLSVRVQPGGNALPAWELPKKTVPAQEGGGGIPGRN